MRVKKQVFLRNWKPKAASVFAAVLLWGYVYYTGKKSIYISIPVYYKNLSEDLAFTGKPLSFIKIEIAGDKDNMKFPTNNLRAEIDLKRARSGKHFYKVNFDFKQIPDKTDIVHIPDKISVQLEKKVIKKVWVYPVIKGHSDPQFRIKSIEVKPRYVRIRGKKKDLNEISEVRTHSIDISGESKTIYVEKSLEKNNLYEVLYKKNVAVEIQFYHKSVKREEVEKLLKGIPIHISGLVNDIDIKLSYSNADVVVLGDKAVMSSVQMEHVYAFIVADSVFKKCKKEAQKKITGVRVHAQIMEKNMDVQIKKITPGFVEVTCQNKTKPSEEETENESNEKSIKDSENQEEDEGDTEKEDEEIQN